MTDETESATVLVVEDEPGLANLYEQFLDETYSVITAFDGSAALEAMSDDVDVVLLDRRMPGLSGAEVLETIREEGYDCRIAMVTAITPDVDIIAMGFDDYITKPVDGEQLHETVERLLELNAYNDLVEEYYRLASKKATLEAESSVYHLSEHDEFARLTERIEELEAELDARESIPSETDIRSLLDFPGMRPDDR